MQLDEISKEVKTAPIKGSKPEWYVLDTMVEV
jgi:hypothetical protein